MATAHCPSDSSRARVMCVSALSGGFDRGRDEVKRKESTAMLKNFAVSVKKFLVSEDGPTAVEYAVMLALIVIVCLTSISAIGTKANSTFDAVQNAMP